MVQQRLQHWIEHPEELGTESLYELRQLLVQYPFFQTARILYLKNLYLLRDPSFKDELRKGALFVADLSILFYAIEGDKFVINRHVAEKENVSTETSDRTLDLIDRFLADDKDLSVEKLFPLPVEAVDYTSVLMEKEENTETASVNPLRGQDLIDHFIEQAAREEAEGVEPIKEAALLEEESSSETVETEEVVPDTEKEESDTEEGEDYFTETLAKIYVKQQRYDKALEIIKKLNLQNSKGGGLSSSFASSNQIMGVRKTTDFIEKLTWGLAAFMVVISVATSYVVPSQVEGSSVIMEQAVKEQKTNPLNAPAGFAAPQKTDAAATTAPAAVNDSAKN